jgi:hypothetical protein
MSTDKAKARKKQLNPYRVPAMINGEYFKAIELEAFLQWGIENDKLKLIPQIGVSTPSVVLNQQQLIGQYILHERAEIRKHYGLGIKKKKARK